MKNKSRIHRTSLIIPMKLKTKMEESIKIEKENKHVFISATHWIIEAIEQKLLKQNLLS